MSKISSMVDIDLAYLKRLLRINDLTSDSFLSQLKEKIPASQLSLSTFNENLKNSKMSPENLNAVKFFFNLNRKQLDILTKSKEMKVFFRREKKAAFEEEAKHLVRELVEIYSAVIPNHLTLEPIPVYDSHDEVQFARILRSKLRLSSYKLSFNEVQSSAGDFGIFINFYPFEYLGIKKSDSRDYRAVSVNKDKKWFVFLDVRNSLEESLFDVLQEISYIFLGQNNVELETHNKTIDDLCFAVASEIVTPSNYFNANRSELLNHFSKDSQFSEGKLSLIQQFLGCSYESIIRALVKHDLIDQSVTRRLYQSIQSRPSADLSELIESIQSAELPTSDSPYLNFFQLIKAAFLCGKVSEDQLKRVFRTHAVS